MKERKNWEGKEKKNKYRDKLSVDENYSGRKTKRAEECEAECKYTSMAVIMVGKILEPVAMPTRAGLQHLLCLSIEGLKSDE